jgi:hypothetical protein
VQAGNRETARHIINMDCVVFMLYCTINTQFLLERKNEDFTQRHEGTKARSFLFLCVFMSLCEIIQGKMKKILVFFALLTNTANVCNAVDMEMETNYVTLPNGVMADAGIPEDLIEMILKRFEAIENGDIAAFRSTLGEMEDGVDYYYQLGLIYTYFGDFFDITDDDFRDAVASSEGLAEIANALFFYEYPLRKRDTGLRVKKIEYGESTGLIVTAVNNQDEEACYYFTYY